MPHPDRSFPRSVRLLDGSDFRRALGRGSECYRGQAIEVRYRRNDRGEARLGLTVPRRTLRRAVDRNQLKRIVRESFREQRGRLPAVDVLVRPRRSLRIVNPATVRADLSAAWSAIRESWQ